MIRINIYRSTVADTITNFHVHGHAGFADAGQDIVCAGVSAITVGTVNSIQALLGTELHVKSMKKGDLEVELPAGERDTDEQEQLLLESMLVMLRTIEQSYKEYVTIKEEQVV